MYTTRQLKEELRDGQYAWPGSYERTYVTSDGEVLCHTCVLANLRTIFTAMRDPCDTSGWRIEGCQSTEYQEEYEALYCAHCNRTITEQTEPNVDGGDITTEDYHTFYQYGKFAAYVPDDVDWQPVLRMHMELTSYYPSVWHCSDHGNWTLLNAQEDAA